MAICLTPKNVDAQNKYENFGPHAAYAITWQNKTGNWYAVGPVQSIQVASKEEKKALAEVYNSGSATFLGECGKYRVYYLGVDYKSSDLDVLKYIRKYGYSCNWPTSSPPKLGEKNNQASNTSKIQSGESSKNKNEFYTMTISSGNNQNTTNSTTKSNQDKSNTSVSNLYTTNNSSLKENNTAQEKSVVSNINLKKNKSVEYSNKGNQFYSKGSYDEAEMYWEKALKLDPNNQAAKNNLDNLKSIQNSNAQIMAQSQQRANDFNAQQQNIQQSSENIANNLVDGSPNAVGQAGVATAKLLAESGAGYAESMLGGAGVAVVGALLNGAGNGKKLGLTGENIRKEYKNATYVGGFYDGKFDGIMKVILKDGTEIEGNVVKNSVYGYICKTNISIPSTCKGNIFCSIKESKTSNTLFCNILANKEGSKKYEIDLNLNNGDKYQGGFSNYYNNYRSGIYHFKNGTKLITKGYCANNIDQQQKFRKDKILFNNGNSVEGSFTQMIRSGKSEYAWSDNDKYTCEFEDGKRVDKLEIFFNNGDSFHANYKNNIFIKGKYHKSNGTVDELITTNLDKQNYKAISQDNLLKIFFIVYEDLIKTNNIEKAKVVLDEIRDIYNHTQLSKISSLENQLSSFLVECNAFILILPSIELNVSHLISHLNRGFAHYQQNNFNQAAKHYYSASKMIKCIPDIFLNVSELKKTLNQIEEICSSKYNAIAFGLEQINEQENLENLFSSLDYKTFSKLINKAYRFNYYPSGNKKISHQDYSYYLNETVSKKEKFGTLSFTYYESMILPSYNKAAQSIYLKYKDYVSYIEWLTNKTPSRQEYRRIYPY